MKTPTMTCHICSARFPTKKSETFKIRKPFSKLGKIRKFHFSFCITTIFLKAYKIHLQTEKHLPNTGKILRYNKCQINFDNNEQFICPKKYCDFAIGIIVIMKKGNIKVPTSILVFKEK